MELTKQEARDFFAVIYNGEHHIPGGDVKPFGEGWYIIDPADIATYDYNKATQYVVWAHKKAIRVSFMRSQQGVKVAIHKRQREGSVTTRHPDLTDGLADTLEWLYKVEKELKLNGRVYEE